MKKTFFLLLLSMMVLMPSMNTVAAETKSSSVDAVTLMAQLRAAGSQAGALWDRLPTEQQDVVLKYLNPKFYQEGKHGRLVSITSKNTSAPIEHPLHPSQRLVATGSNYEKNTVESVDVQAVSQPNGGCRGYYLQNVVGRSQSDAVPAAAGTSGTGPITLTLSSTRTDSNTWSANVGVDAGTVSAGVGFDVTRENSITDSASFYVPGGQTWELDAYDRFNNYSYDVWYDPCFGNAYYTGNGRAGSFANIVDYVTWQVS